MKYVAVVLLATAAYGQRGFGNSGRSGYRGGGGVQTLQSSPLPPHGYVSPSAYRQQTEPPKPFAYKYEGPDPYGGYSSHESQGDEYGRITGQYTVQNPDGTSRVVKYVADPETGFHAEVDTDEEGTKTSEPANALIRSSAPEDTYQTQQQKPYGAPAPYAGGSAYRAAASRKAPAYKTASNFGQSGAYNRPGAYKRPGAYNTPAPFGRAYNTPAPFARPGAYKPATSAFARPGAYKATPTYGSSFGGFGSSQNTGAYRPSSQQGAYRGSNQFGNQYKAAASYRTPTTYQAPGAYRQTGAYRPSSTLNNRPQSQVNQFGRKPYY